MASAQTDCSLLKLPPELRNRIYDMVFEGNVRRLDKGEKQSSGSVALLQTCQQIHNEALASLYKQSIFTFIEYASGLKWLTKLSSTAIGQQRLKLITDIRFDAAAYWMRRREKQGNSWGFLGFNKSKANLYTLAAELKKRGIELQTGALKASFFREDGSMFLSDGLAHKNVEEAFYSRDVLNREKGNILGWP